MRRLAPYLITLPLLAYPFATLGANTASAQAIGASDAVAMLAKSAAADAKCGHLDEPARQELADYLAMAEVAAAERDGVDVARSALAIGRTDGAESLCGSESVAEVEATLGMAREAMAAAEREQVREEAIARPVELPKPKKPTPSVAAGLAQYEHLAAAYYVERRCGHLSNDEAKTFWNRIVNHHRAALARFGNQPVASALARAEAGAKRQSCGLRSASMVRSGFRASL